MKRLLAAALFTTVLLSVVACSTTPIDSYWDPRDEDLDPGQLQVFFTEPYEEDPGVVELPGGLMELNQPVRLYVNDAFIGTPVGSTVLTLPPGDYTIRAQPLEGVGKQETVVVFPAGRQELRFVFTD